MIDRQFGADSTTTYAEWKLAPKLGLPAVSILVLIVSILTSVRAGWAHGATPGAGPSLDRTATVLVVADSSRWEAAALPALSYDADEGFGYGLMGAVYAYGPSGGSPYRFTLQPKVLRTTGGRRDYEIFFDAPGRLLEGWYLTAELFREKLLAAPYYGTGNDAPYRPELEETHPHYYRYRQVRNEASVTIQRAVSEFPIRLLAGWRLGWSRYEPHARAAPEANLFLQRRDGTSRGTDRMIAPRVGLVWDSRSRRVGPRTGTWSEVLFQRASAVLGSDRSFSRLTVIDRRYWALSSRLVLATRLIGRQMWENPPFHELVRIQTSGVTLDGLGGSDTVRGVPKNRVAGEAMMVVNLVLRGRIASVRVFGSEIDLLGTVFTDAGRVWSGRPVASEIVRELHAGAGGGLRLRVGRSLVVGGEMATGAETETPIYVRFGYLF